MQQDTELFLFHYTAAGTAAKIVASRELWATNIYYLNDGSEFTHGISLMRRCLVTLAAKNPHAASFLDAVEWPALSSPRLSVFVVSFSEAADLLSQWRSYCPPNRGVSLGFELEKLREAAATQHFELIRCNYDLPSQEVEVLRMARRWINRYARATTDGKRTAVIKAFAVTFAHAAASYKDPSFDEEREWRLVAVRTEQPGDMKYREGTTTLIPYITFSLPKDAKDRLRMRRICVGPSAHWALAYNAISRMMHDANVLHGQIWPSRTPFRAW